MINLASGSHKHGSERNLWKDNFKNNKAGRLGWWINIGRKTYIVLI